MHNENLHDNLICTTYNTHCSIYGIIFCRDKDMLLNGIDILSQETISENVFTKDYDNPMCHILFKKQNVKGETTSWVEKRVKQIGIMSK